MKAWRLLLYAAIPAAVGVGVFIGASWRASSTEARGSIETGFDPPRVQLGRQPWFGEAPFSARFVNRSKEPVTIETVKASCGCTALNAQSFAGRRVEPGEAVSLAGTLTVGSLVGRHAKRIDLLLDSGAIHSVFVDFEGFATYEVSPDILKFGIVDLDAEADVPIMRAVFRSESVSLTGRPKSDSAWIAAD